jgi:hypothetical protein
MAFLEWSSLKTLNPCYLRQLKQAMVERERETNDEYDDDDEL